MNKLFIILFSLVFVLGQVARIQFANGVSLLGLDVVVGVFSLIWFLRAIVRRKVPKSFILKPLLLFVLVAFVSLLVNLTWISLQEAIVSMLYLVRFVAYAGLYFFLREFSKDEVGTFKNYLLGVITAVVSIGLFQHVYYPNLGNLYYLGWDDHLYRLFSTFFDPNFAGAIFVFFFLYVSIYLKKIMTFSVYKQIFLLLLSFSTLISVFLTYSRTGLVMLIGGGISYLLFLRKKVLIGFFLLLVSILFLFTINPSIEGLNPFRIASSKARIESYNVAIDIFSRHPIIGVGFNAYRYAQNEYGYRVSGNWETSHADAGTDNSFLFVLATTGIIGFVAFMHMLFRIFLFTYTRIKEGSEIARVTFASLIALCIGSFFINALFYPFIMAWMWILVAFTDSDA